MTNRLGVGGGGNSTWQLFLEAHNLFNLRNGREVDLERGSRQELAAQVSEGRAHGQQRSFTAVITGSRRYYDTPLLDALVLLPATNATITLKIVE